MNDFYLAELFIEKIYESDGVTPKKDRSSMPYSFLVGAKVQILNMQVGTSLVCNKFRTSEILEVEDIEDRVKVVTKNTIYIFNKNKVEVPKFNLKNLDETMNIYTPAGYKVMYAFPESGYELDKEYNEKIGLVVGQEYTVSGTDVGGSYTTVYLEEFPDESFNSVNFANAE